MITSLPSLVFLDLSSLLSVQSVNYLLLSLAPQSIELVEQQLILTLCEFPFPLFDELLAEVVYLLRNPERGLSNELFVAATIMHRLFS